MSRINIKRLATTALIAFAATVIPSGGGLRADPRAPIPPPTEGSGIAQWTPTTDYESTALAVSDPRGEVRTFDFAAGRAPALSLFDAAGNALIDGTYTWELRLTTRRGAKPLMQTGYFTLEGGHLIPTDVPEAPTGRQRLNAEDQTVPDDLIVDGKACLGLGCVNNETFGAEALRLKQGVVWLQFEDSSTNPLFPTHDWRLTVNDAGSGGADRFSLEDLTAGTTPLTVRGAAPTNALYVDGTGKVGLGTAVPSTALHLASGDPSIRLEQTGGSPRSWKLSGSAASFALTDQGVDGSATAAPLSVAAGAPADSLFVAANGNFGFGTASPTERVHLTNGRMKIGGHTFGERFDAPTDVQMSGLRNVIFNIDSDNNSTNASFSVSRDGVPNLAVFITREDGKSGFNFTYPAAPLFPLHVGTDATNGNGAHVTVAGVWTNGSSRVNKENIRLLDADAAVSALSALAPVRYTGKASNDGEEYLGFIAEDVPALVAMNDRTGLSPMDIVAVLTKVAQEQQRTIGELETLVTALGARVEELEALGAHDD